MRAWAWDVAIVVSTARPIAPPTNRDVLSRPDARPLSAAGTPRTAMIVAGTSAKPSPNAESTPPGRTGARYVPAGLTPASSARPAGAEIIPAVSTTRAPIFGISLGARVAAPATASVIGRNA